MAINFFSGPIKMYARVLYNSTSNEYFIAASLVDARVRKIELLEGGRWLAGDAITEARVGRERDGLWDTILTKLANKIAW